MPSQSQGREVCSGQNISDDRFLSAMAMAKVAWARD